MNTTNSWRIEDGSHYYGPFARTGYFDTELATAEVHKTWSPTRSAAGYTATVMGKVLGRHFQTVAKAKIAITTALFPAVAA